MVQLFRVSCLFFLTSLFCTFAGALTVPSYCQYDEECQIEVPGMVCADGSASYITLTARRNAENILFYLQGGGACWNKTTCKLGFARSLTRVLPHHDWNNGSGIFNDGDENPLHGNYQIITIPYCTGDVFIGDRVINYGTKASPYVIRHHGFKNVQLAMQAAKQLLGEPQKVTLLGASAGGMGSYFHMQTLVNTFPMADKSVISDSGVPLRAPYIGTEAYLNLRDNWGVAHNFPPAFGNEKAPVNFGDLIRYNRIAYPQVRFGLVGSYYDKIMTFFAFNLSSPNILRAVSDTLIETANNEIGPGAPNAKVFYLNSIDHVFLKRSLTETVSLGVTIGSWLDSLLGSKKGWQNVRPDLGRFPNFSEQLLEFAQPMSVNELWKSEQDL